MRLVVLLCAVTLFTGCESDATKLSRLQSERTIKCLVAQRSARSRWVRRYLRRRTFFQRSERQ